MKLSVAQVVVIGGVLGLASGAGVLPCASLNAAVGDTVTLTTSLDLSQTQVKTVSWKIGKRNIITSNSTTFTAPEYDGRITLFMSTASLELRKVALNDSGDYSVDISPAAGPQLDGTATVRVYEPVSNVRINVDSTVLVEDESTARLFCFYSGSAQTILWFKGSSEVKPGGRVNITDRNTTVTILRVRLSDKGPFRCQVQNPVSDSTSDPVNLSINYGPHGLSVSRPTEIAVGGTLRLICTAFSSPVTYNWTLNGESFFNGSEFYKTNIDKSYSGKYICEASNSVTGKSVSLDFDFFVKDSDQDIDQGKSHRAGAIVGIVIACVVFVGLFVFSFISIAPRAFDHGAQSRS